jgi:predicted metal-dependent phosphoesterase TrpH
MHCHSVASDDARATVEQYLKWINVVRRRGYTIDGFVLTEHRQFQPQLDYSSLSREYGVVVLKGAELDTRYGHFLLYGVNDTLMSKFDFSDINMDPIELIAEAAKTGAIAVPAHPGRRTIGLCAHIDQGIDISNIEAVEILNGGSTTAENNRAHQFAQDGGYLGIGGSDAHFVSSIGAILTEFPGDIQDEAGLVRAIHDGGYRVVHLNETLG